MEFRGLTAKEAEKKLLKHGHNEIKDFNKKSIFSILSRQVKNNFIIYLLFFAVILSFIVKDNVTGYTIFGVIIIVIFSGFIQEFRAERAVESLKQLVMPISIVLRDGKEQEISSKKLVPGDIIILKNGEKIPADCIVLEERELFVNESILTGESREIKKQATTNFEKYSDKNLIFAGSFLVSGKCIAKIIETGMDTKFGQIAKLISVAEKELPLRTKVNKITKYMTIAAVIISILTGVCVLLTSEISKSLLIDVLILMIALSVSAFPEGFPVVLITSLSAGAYSMAKKNAIVNRMSIIETLGETTVICTDKTGTLTKGEMTAREIFVDGKTIQLTGAGYEARGDFLINKKKINPEGEKTLSLLLKSAIMCNDSSIQKQEKNDVYQSIGSPTETALLIMSSKAKLFKQDIVLKRCEEIVFNSERKMMSTVFKEKNGFSVYTKGAIEILLNKCSHIQRNSGTYRLLEKDKIKILESVERMSSRSMRIMAFAYKKTNTIKKENIEQDLIFLGFVGLDDPPREEVREALVICKRAGISVKMITGDRKDTAISIARQIGLDEGAVLSGSDIDKLSDRDLIKTVRGAVIFARVNPEHKLRIVKSLKEAGEIVTMTGDGVNDAPALKEAHVGVAMGKNGTDVSRSVADLTLKDDNFATIVDAIAEGRSVFNNIRKFITYQLSCSFSELLILLVGVLLAPVLGWPIPLLLALHILFMNIVTDNLPAVALGLNSSSEDIMLDPPRKKAELLTKNLLILSIFAGIITTLFCLATFWFTFSFLGQSIENARTTTLVSLIMLQIAGSFNFRSFRKGVLNRSLLANKHLFLTSIVSIVATLIIIYTPVSIIFNTVPIPFLDWAIACGFALMLIVVFDVLKKINNNKKYIDFN